MTKDEDRAKSEEFRRFEDATKRILATPKKLIDQKVKENKESNRARRSKG